MLTNAKDEVTRFLALLGESGQYADFEREMSKLDVPEEIKTLLLARDAAGLQQKLCDVEPFITSFLYIRSFTS